MAWEEAPETEWGPDPDAWKAAEWQFYPADGPLLVYWFDGAVMQTFDIDALEERFLLGGDPNAPEPKGILSWTGEIYDEYGPINDANAQEIRRAIAHRNYLDMDATAERMSGGG